MKCPECGNDNVSDYCSFCCADCGFVTAERWCWISVEDRLPKADGLYLVFRTDYNEVRFAEFYKGGWEYSIINLNEYVTHWMPLPEPPDTD